MRKLKNEELNRKTEAEFKAAQKSPIILILDNVRSLNNIGSVFRTADAFLIEKVFLCGITATPPHKDIHKTALGATENVAWEYVNTTLEVVEKLQKEKVQVWAVEQADKALPLSEFIPQQNTKYALVLGHEVQGVNQEVVSQCDGVLEIPQFGTKHSLNISVATGVVVWDVFAKLQFGK
jgi:23S rRNA (guanosine2251-2'-O)-methyltransferase